MARPHLLLVDADPRSLRVIEVNLKNDGFSVTTASDGAAALEQAKVGLPDLVVTETRLPRMDGFELVRRIRELPGGEALPVVFIAPEATPSATGLSPSQNDQVRAVQLNVLDCLVRPVSVRELVTRVNLLLARRTQALFAAPGGSQLHFSGHLEDIAVIDMLRAFEQGRRSGLLNIEHGSRQATILFKHGKVLDAEQGHLRGEEAVYRTFLWSTGVYDLEFCEIDVPDAIPIGMSALLMEGMRRIDEWGRLAEQLPSSSVVFAVDAPVLLQRLSEVPDELNPVLRLFDGERSLMAVIDESPFDDLSTLSVISKLYFEGVLRTVETPPRALGGTLRALSSGAANEGDATGRDGAVRLAAELAEPNVRPHAPVLSPDPIPHTIVYCEPPQSVRLSQRQSSGKATAASSEPTPEEVVNALRTNPAWPVVAVPVAEANTETELQVTRLHEAKAEASRDTKVVAEAEFEEVSKPSADTSAPAVVAESVVRNPKGESATAAPASVDEGSFFAKGEQGTYSHAGERTSTSRPSDEAGDVEIDPRLLSVLTERRGQGLRWAAFIVGAALLLCGYVVFGVFRARTTKAEPPLTTAPPLVAAPPPPPMATEAQGTSEATNETVSLSDEEESSAEPLTTAPVPPSPAAPNATTPKVPLLPKSKPPVLPASNRPPTARFPTAPDPNAAP